MRDTVTSKTEEKKAALPCKGRKIPALWQKKKILGVVNRRPRPASHRLSKEFSRTNIEHCRGEEQFHTEKSGV